MIMTFAQLIEKYGIVIPMIQRDYAQGRTDAKATLVRENLIENMKGAFTRRETFRF
ncbi:hypothetical protein ACT7CU_09670 [Bacillus paranthracis]